MLKLYELPDLFHAWERAVEANDGELTPELEAELAALDASLSDRVDAVCAAIRSAEAEEEATAYEVRRLQQRRDVAKHRAARLKQYLLSTIDAIGTDRVSGARFKARVQTNSAPSIRWLGRDNDLPERFRRVSVEMDGRAAIDAFRRGELPDGFEVSTGRHVRIS